MEVLESSRQTTEPINESSETLFRSRSCFPCFGRRRSLSTSPAVDATWWQSQRIRTAEISAAGNSLWARSVGAVMKIREWSELVAGPRWKTFIRRFNRNRSGSRHADFQYDPLGYAMNFDEGAGDGGDITDDDGYYYGSRNFWSRYAMGKEGPTFVKP